ncbi:MAG: hypothetical protein ACI92Z_001302 [Paracoccaceae bacterium]|jgi:hypothetical protein
MANLQTNTPWRAGYSRLKTWLVQKSGWRNSLSKIRRFWRDPWQSYPRLTDRQAQDIGLDPADMEWSRLQLPSQTTRHPML